MHLPKAIKSRGHLPSLTFQAVRHMAICGKMVDIISGHKQFDVASAISNLKKNSL